VISIKKFMLYKFYYGKHCVYLGRTAQPIAYRIRGHFFAKPMHKTVGINVVTKIEIAQCKSEADMYLYEIYYINLLKPTLNRDDKACDDLNVFLPELEFVEYEPKLMEKWKAQITEREAEKERKQQELSDWQNKRSEARKTLKGDSWHEWLDKNPRP
jgi:hypothetical protein